MFYYIWERELQKENSFSRKRNPERSTASAGKGTPKEIQLQREKEPRKKYSFSGVEKTGRKNHKKPREKPGEKLRGNPGKKFPEIIREKFVRKSGEFPPVKNIF
ncbi:MAG: hypothetical protein GX876_09975 [Bacteroidales bacterium]|nr:hypothetical protein [Bacteroidales bacterium]